ncbi:hypothetical protein Tco_1168446 [Tanacetum coccineum]
MVYCFTHMLKELKNSVATLQRMEEKNGRNIEVYLEEIVMKNRSEQSLIQDVEETVDKLRRVNVKIDPSKCTFGIEEGKFLGFVPKLTELIHPIRNIRKCSDVKEGSNWMSGAEEAPLEQATSIDHSKREGGADDLSTARE